MLWSQVSIPGRPTLLVIDASRDLHGWEAQFCDRLCASMQRRGLPLKGGGPARVDRPDALKSHLEAGGPFNCILLLGHAQGDGLEAEARMGSYWASLRAHTGLPPMLLAACTWEDYDPTLSKEILEGRNSFAPLALAQRSALSPREASLYFLKFFTELALHSGEAITGRMVWFADSKARELLRRRRLPGVVGARC